MRVGRPRLPRGLPAQGRHPGARATELRRVTGRLTRHPSTLSEEEHQHLKTILARCPELQATHQHIRDFGEILTCHLGALLPDWIDTVVRDDLPGLTGYARSMNNDFDAIKKIKRQLYGRAEFELLRKLILLACPTVTASRDHQPPLSRHEDQRVHNLSVDQGIAALLGATVGVLGTVSTSAISGWSSRQQIRAQARVDHAQWRRQARRDAYSAFLAPAHETRNALKGVARALIGNADVEEAGPRLQAAHDRLGEVQAAWAALAVEGPESVEQAANGVKTALHSMHTTLLAWHDSPVYPHNVKFVERHAVEVTLVSERLSIFTTAARAALDEATLPVGASNG